MRSTSSVACDWPWAPSVEFFSAFGVALWPSGLVAELPPPLPPPPSLPAEGSSAPALGQPYVAPPGMPADRLAVLRDAFAATLKDEAFLADAEKIRFDVDPIGAADTATIVHETTHASPDIIAKAKLAMGIADR